MHRCFGVIDMIEENVTLHFTEIPLIRITEQNFFLVHFNDISVIVQCDKAANAPCNKEREGCTPLNGFVSACASRMERSVAMYPPPRINLLHQLQIATTLSALRGLL